MQKTKVVAKILATALALGALTVADAAASSTTKHKHPAGVHGIILSVEKASSQISVRTGSAKKHDIRTFRITIGNGVTIEGKGKSSSASSLSSVHAGDRVIIEPDTANPTTIVDLGGGSKRRHARRAR